MVSSSKWHHIHLKPKCVATGGIKKQPAMNGSWVLSDIINENIHVHILREYMHENDSFLEIKNLSSQKGNSWRFIFLIHWIFITFNKFKLTN